MAAVNNFQVLCLRGGLAGEIDETMRGRQHEAVAIDRAGAEIAGRLDEHGCPGANVAGGRILATHDGAGVVADRSSQREREKRCANNR